MSLILEPVGKSSHTNVWILQRFFSCDSLKLNNSFANDTSWWTWFYFSGICKRMWQRNCSDTGHIYKGHRRANEKTAWQHHIIHALCYHLDIVMINKDVALSLMCSSSKIEKYTRSLSESSIVKVSKATKIFKNEFKFEPREGNQKKQIHLHCTMSQVNINTARMGTNIKQNGI